MSLLTCALGLASLFVINKVQDPSSVIPVDRLGEDWWKQRHEQCVEVTKKGGVELLFLGDSITQGWEGEGQKAWPSACCGLKAANFGFSGDRTEHVLWRMQHGEIVGLDPKVVVLMIGTNNVGHGTSNAEQTAIGVKAVVSALLKGLPHSKILLLGIFPRGEAPSDPMRVAVNKATSDFSTLKDGHRVFFEDIGYAFVRSDGVLRTMLMPDRLHLNSDGYEIWAKAIAPIVEKLAKS